MGHRRATGRAMRGDLNSAHADDQQGVGFPGGLRLGGGDRRGAGESGGRPWFLRFNGRAGHRPQRLAQGQLWCGSEGGGRLRCQGDGRRIVPGQGPGCGGGFLLCHYLGRPRLERIVLRAMCYPTGRRPLRLGGLTVPARVLATSLAKASTLGPGRTAAYIPTMPRGSCTRGWTSQVTVGRTEGRCHRGGCRSRCRSW